MKFFLTIWICSVVNQNCAEVPFEKHEYDRFYASHYECVQKGEKTDNSKNEQSDTTLSESKDL